MGGCTIQGGTWIDENVGVLAEHRFQGFLLGNSHEVETGATLDLSIGGAKFESDLDVYPGKMIRVRLIIPGAEVPISIEDARVQWVGEDSFGVSFQNVRPGELDELEELIDEYEDVKESGNA